jgi:hypothetical protein
MQGDTGGQVNILGAYSYCEKKQFTRTRLNSEWLLREAVWIYKHKSSVYGNKEREIT